MRRKPVQILIFVFVALLVLTAAGCGKKKAATTDTTAATTTTAAAAGESTMSSETTTSSSNMTTTEAAATTTNSSSSLGSLASAKNCAQLANVGQAFAQAMQGANGDLSKSAQIFKEFADKTPSDIKPDFELVASALQKYADALKGVDLTSGQAPDPSTLAKLTQLTGELDTAALTKAENHISAWAQNNCHA
jgi:hypothetical protein